MSTGRIENLVITNPALNANQDPESICGSTVEFEYVVDPSQLKRRSMAPIYTRLQHILVNEIQTWAFDRIEIYRNESNCRDESLALEIGLLPLQVVDLERARQIGGPVKDLDNSAHDPESRNEMTYQAGSQTVLEPYFELNVTAPASSVGFPFRVSSGDFMWPYPGPEPLSPNSDCSLCFLDPGKRLILRAYLSSGTGRLHNKWCPVIAPRARQVGPGRCTFKFDLTGQLSPHQLIDSLLEIYHQQPLEPNPIQSMSAAVRSGRVDRNGRPIEFETPTPVEITLGREPLGFRDRSERE